MERDALDFGRMNIPRLFIKLFVPTLLGLLFGALLNLADGIFVGRGVGSDALAAVNIAAPLFLVATGLALVQVCLWWRPFICRAATRRQPVSM